MIRIRNGRAGRLVFIVATTASLLALASTVGASNATLRTSVNSWSRTIGVDAHSVALAAQNRHPRRMTSSAVRFRTDALHARAAVAHQRPSTAAGKRAQKLALAAFTDYAAAAQGWAATGRARLRGDRVAAGRQAGAAATSARAGNRLLIAAGKILH
ncbi:MAG TPA: hypothetical protein VFD90_17925 [Gaiellales bacterium]|jgi:hypothetical protein|nr:hypothetical protein [Gaiellales bacterium]